MKKLSNKGFTLIELLATILIIGLVLGLTTYGIISSVKSAKDEGSKLTLAGIKEAARTYSNEYTDDTWKASNKLNNIYFCTTIQELINKGLLDKNAKNVEGNTIGLNDYIAVVKDKTTKVIKKEFVLTLQAFNEDEEKHEAHQYCTGNIKPEDIKKLPIINKKNTYTDTIIAEFTDAEFKTKDGNVSNIKKRECLYDETTSGNFTSKGTITNKECKIEGLVQNKNYYVKVCMTSKNDSRACSTPEIVKTKEVKSPSININTNDSIKITYDDTNIIDENGNHYFKSDVNATSNKNVSTCNEEGETFSCSSDSTINITEDKWYKVDDKEVKLSYTNSGDITIAAVTRDKSGNYKSTDKNYSLYKIIFSRGTADTIGGQTNDIKKLCLVNKDETCTITSPIIKKAGYNVVGWNTDSNAMTSTWSQNTSKNINKSETYFPIVKLKTYTIKYNANGGSGAPSNQVKEHNKNITLSTSKPIRTGYTFVNWNTSSAGNGTSYSAGATYSGNSDITMYAQWRRNRVIINFSVNGGTLISTAAYSVDANGIVTKNGSNLHSMYYNDTIMSTGLPNYNNSSYLNIMRNGYEGVSGAEWKCLSGNCTKQTYSQDTNTYKASDFCDASKTDCTITLGVNWTEVSTKTMYINANIGLNCRSGSGTSYSIVTAYACGVPVKVRTKLVNDWWYEVDDKCYMSKGGTGSDGNWKDYLVDSRSKLTCPTSSGGSGGSGGDSSEGKLLNCTCNEDADCGVAGGNLINLYCDTNMKSGKTEKEGKYMCAWKNKYKPNVTHWCWTR
jgi:leucine-rich repeat (lrr) protein